MVTTRLCCSAAHTGLPFEYDSHGRREAKRKRNNFLVLKHERAPSHTINNTAEVLLELHGILKINKSISAHRFRRYHRCSHRLSWSVTPRLYVIQFCLPIDTRADLRVIYSL